MEKQFQNEYAHTLNKYGMAIKNQDTVQCHRCHSLIHPKNTGIPDYFFLSNGGIGGFVECKGFEDQFKISQISDDQQAYARDILSRTGREVWLFLMGGTLPVNSKQDERRRLWLLPLDTMNGIFRSIEDLTGLKYAPLTSGIATKKGSRMKDFGFLNLKSLLLPYELIWKGSEDGWELPGGHMFRQSFQIKDKVNAGTTVDSAVAN